MPYLRRLYILSLAGALSIAITACTSSSTKPLKVPGDEADSPNGWTCLKSQKGNPAISLPIHGIRVVGKETLEIVDIELVQPRHVKLVGAEIAKWPSGNPDRVPTTVIGGPYPPSKKDPKLLWKNGIKVSGAALEPGTAWTLSVGIKPEGPLSVLKRIKVKYVDGSGDAYESQTAEAFMIRGDCFDDHEWPADYGAPSAAGVL